MTDDLQIIINKSDNSKSDSHEQNRNHGRVFSDDEHLGYQEGTDKHDAAHRRRSGLLKMR